ncbi:MAG: hypothetical protein Tsb0020_00110 [Haliangiales bacterium]
MRQTPPQLAYRPQTWQRIAAGLITALSAPLLLSCDALLGIDDLDGRPDARPASDSAPPPVADASTPRADAAPPEPGAIVWVRSLANMNPYDVAPMPDNSLFISGSTLERIELGGDTIEPLGGYDMVFAGIDADSAVYRWSTSVGDVGGEFPGSALPAGPDGSLFIRGVSYDTVNLGQGTIAGAGGADGFIGRYSANGGPPMWLQRIATADEDKFLGQATGPGGSVFVTGYFVDAVTLDDTELAGAGNRDVLLARLAGADGSVLFARSWGDDKLDEGRALAWTGERVILAGTFVSTISFDNRVALVSAGGRDVFVALLSPDGEPESAVSFGGVGNDNAVRVRVDSDDNIYLYGTFEDQVGFGAVNLRSAGGQDVFLAKLSPEGDPLWARSFGGLEVEDSFQLSVAPDGTVFIAGASESDLDLGAGVIPNRGGLDAFIASYEPTTGAHRWSHVFGSGGDDRAWDIKLDNKGSVYALIDSESPIPWDPAPRGPAADPRGVLLKLAR